MARPRHPKRVIEDAIRYAESRGWWCDAPLHGHAWGRLYCPGKSRGACQKSVWSTPKDPTAHARRIRAFVDACRCTKGGSS